MLERRGRGDGVTMLMSLREQGSGSRHGVRIIESTRKQTTSPNLRLGDGRGVWCEGNSTTKSESWEALIYLACACKVGTTISG